MEHYVTLFDSLFLPQGLALHMSMERHAGSYTLWVLCLDGTVYRALDDMALPNVRLLDLAALESDQLLAVKVGRTRGEYCWTLTPFAPRFVFAADPLIDRVTYIDADLWLMKSPSEIFREFAESGKHVLITDHGYAPECDASATSGRFCVQFMVFTRHGGEAVRQWWEEQCIKWCYARFEDGKFGDQKYLDDWPTRFPDHVHVLAHKEWTLAPWNATRFPYGDGMFWHFHAFRLVERSGGCVSRADFGPYALPRVTRKNVYKPYVSDIAAAIGLMRQHGIEPSPQIIRTHLDRLKSLLRALLRESWRFLQSGSGLASTHQ